MLRVSRLVVAAATTTVDDPGKATSVPGVGPAPPHPEHDRDELTLLSASV